MREPPNGTLDVSSSPLKRKLPPLLANHEVTLVYPVAQDRYIVKPQDDPHMPTGSPRTRGADR